MADHKNAVLANAWSNLPQEIISKIEKRLNNGIVLFQFRSVCKNWSSTRKPDSKNLLCPSLPCKISNVNLPFTDRSNDPVILFARAVFHVEPRQSSLDSSGWFLTVEEIVPGKLRILYPLSIDHVKNLPSNFPRYLDLSKFRVSEVAKSYGLKYASDAEDVAGVQKVIFCSGSTPTAMVLYGKGTLVGVRLKNGNWGYVRDSLICSFNDVIKFKGMIYAVDCYLDVLMIDYATMNVIDRSYGESGHRSICSMRLVESNSELYLIKWYSVFSNGAKIQFDVYIIDQFMTKRDPEKCLILSTIFVGLEWCFLADIPGINGKYIVYSGDCFTSSANRCPRNNQLFEDASLDLAIGVFFRTDENLRDDYSWIKSMWMHIADWLWPPPVWFLPETFTISRDDENNEEFNSYNPDASSPNPYSTVDPGRAAIIKQESGPKIAGMDVHTVAEDSHALTLQNLSQNSSTIVFKELHIKSNLLPILQKVWAKYGNILEGSIIRNGDMISRALESLATALLILQTNSGRSLDKIQADYLSSVLSDLQHMNFKVEWLVCFVDKALAIHKSRSLIDSLKLFGRAKAQAEEMKLKVLDELAKLDEVEEDLVFVSERLPVLESMDLDQCLGEGLY